MLQVQSLSYEIKGRSILREIDISIQKGEFYAIVGFFGQQDDPPHKYACTPLSLGHAAFELLLNDSVPCEPLPPP